MRIEIKNGRIVQLPALVAGECAPAEQAELLRVFKLFEALAPHISDISIEVKPGVSCSAQLSKVIDYLRKTNQ